MVSLRVCAVLFAMALPASAADISGLSWGDYIASETSTAKASKIDASAAARSLSLTMAVEDFSASAEGEKTDAAATLSGSFLVSQPSKLQLTSLHAKVSGIIVKTQGSTARLDLAFGDTKSVIEWTEAETKSERFTREFDAIIPNGKLQSPFVITAFALVKKPGKEGAALVTLDSIDIQIGEALVGTREPDKKPAPQIAAPALVASKN
jgi:hypothetical protein